MEAEFGVPKYIFITETILKHAQKQETTRFIKYYKTVNKMN